MVCHLTMLCQIVIQPPSLQTIARNLHRILAQLGQPIRLHWLPARQRVLFKITVLVYQCPNGLAPSYLADDCQLVSDVRPRQLRSSDCDLRRPTYTQRTYRRRRRRLFSGTRTTYGDRCFAVAGPQVWNSLPTELRQSDSLGQFKRRLKTIRYDRRD